MSCKSEAVLDQYERRSGDETVTEISNERILQPTVGDVTLSGVITEDDTGQKPAGDPPAVGVRQ